MFADLMVIVDFLFGQAAAIFDMQWNAGWLGVILICVPLALWVVDIFNNIY